MSAIISFTGRLAGDPEALAPKGGGANYVKFSVAITTKNKDKSEHTDWYQCTAFGFTGEFIATYFKKGSWIFVSGEHRMRAYVSKKSGEAACAGDVKVSTASFCGAKVDRSDDRGDGPKGKPQDDHAPPVDDSDVPF